MSHWTHAGAYIAAFALVATGCVGLACGLGWPAVAVVSLAVALLAALLLTGHFSDVRAANSVLGDVGALKMEVHRLSERVGKAEEKAGNAIAASMQQRAKRNDY